MGIQILGAIILLLMLAVILTVILTSTQGDVLDVFSESTDSTQDTIDNQKTGLTDTLQQAIKNALQTGGNGENEDDSPSNSVSGSGDFSSQPGCVGGGECYEDTFCQEPQGATVVSSASEFKSALRSGDDIIYVEPGSTIDLTGDLNVEIPGGTTIASSRGCSNEPGRIIQTSQPSEQSEPMLASGGPDIRITGLQFDGPGDHGEPHERSDNGVAVQINHGGGEIDNNRFDNWPQICTWTTESAHVHHNHITYCNRLGYGYGVSTQAMNPPTMIEYNQFDHTRHAIAAHGNSYTAQYNIFGPHRQSHQSDMHNQPVSITLRHNTFMHWEGQGTYDGRQHNPQVNWGGVPTEQSEIVNNWIQHPSEAIWLGDIGGSYRVGSNTDEVSNTRIEGNHFGFDEPGCDIGAPREGCENIGQ